MNEIKKESAVVKTGKRIWKFFEGKKTFIGLGLLLANAIVSSKFPDVTSPEITKVVDYIGYSVAGVGFADKGRRTSIGQKWQSKLTGKNQ